MALVSVLVFTLGCANTRKAERSSGARYRITQVELVGVERFSEQEFLSYLNMRQSSKLPFRNKYHYNEALVAVDRERIVELYAAHGYHEARVLAIEPTFHGKRDRVSLKIVVDEGKPIITRTVQFVWPDGTPRHGPAHQHEVQRSVEAYAKLATKRRFEIPRLEQSVVDMRMALQNLGYAWAEVNEHAQVDRVRRVADVMFELRPGPFVRIAQVKLEGIRTVPKKSVMVEVEHALGKPYSLHLERHVEQAVYALGVFSAVTIDKAPRPNDPHRIDLVVRVQEAPPQSVRVGVGMGIEPNRWEQRVTTRYSHGNLFRTLTRLDVTSRVGYAELPAFWNPREHGPVVAIEPRLTKKGLLEKHLVWTLAPSFELGIQEGYQFYALVNRIGVSRFFTRFVQVELSHNVRYNDFFSVSSTLDRTKTLLGRDYRDPYLLSYLEPVIRLYFVDDISEPHNGVVISAIYNLAGVFLGGQFDYQKVIPEIRGYWSPHERVQLAARTQVGFIFPLEPRPAVPFDQKLYLGGANTVRGWGLRRLSPRLRPCEDPQQCDDVPVGGYTSVLGNLELRVRIFGDVWTAVFVDGGDVRADVREFVPRGWNYSTGGGVRYHSKIGTFRADVGVRLTQDERFDDVPIWAIHFSLGEAF